MMTNGFDGSMMNNLQTLTVWKSYFKDPKGGTLGLFNAIQSIGGLAGLPFAPYLNDYMGRRYTIFLGSCIMLVGVALQTAAQNIGMFIGARFLLGFGLAFSALASPTLLTELAFPTHRAPLTSLFNTSWYLGSIVAAWTTYGTFFIKNNWAWRIPSLFQGIPSVLQVALILTIPESPRWLVHKGREEAARKVLVKYHAGGDAADPLVDFELNEIKLALALDREANRTSSWKSMFTERGNLRRMRIIMAIGFFSQWYAAMLSWFWFFMVADNQVRQWSRVVLPQLGPGWRRDHQQQPAAHLQRCPAGLQPRYGLRGGTARRPSGTTQALAHIGRRHGTYRYPRANVGADRKCFSYTLWTVGSGVFAKSRLPADAEGNPLHPNKAAGNLVLAMIFFYYAFYNIAMSALLVSYTVEM
jgi:MFS family permease